ncbi:SHOCT domain-containing protein [Paraburkholderia aromaticivorans]|uniref:SHOCT domain-containing protein n=1 Tax=Paraburkholderia aromaticivorans TaxID=2026199 RepID=UPI00145610B5|nr:SHOCT domain-containing protein [Paraburkholderia aromaticivorans]
MKKTLLLAAMLLTGCASVSDIHTSKADPDCAHSCSANYSECLGKFTLFPIQAQHQCTDALRLCVAACPARGSVAASPVSNPSQRLANLDDLYKRGLISKGEYDAKRAEVLKGL